MRLIPWAIAIFTGGLAAGDYRSNSADALKALTTQVETLSKRIDVLEKSQGERMDRLDTLERQTSDTVIQLKTHVEDERR